MIRRLLLWDIDGTLLRAGDVAAKVFDEAVARVTGISPVERPLMSGKTDPQIVAEYLEALGVAPEPETVASILRNLESALFEERVEIAARGHVCPGVPEVLRAVAGRPEVVSSLLTGNIAPNAVVKVEAFDLARWLDMEVGAYGSDDADRLVLVPIAMQRVAEQRGARLEPHDVWVIGDTERDLACARAAGARCLLVGTGRTPADSLVKLGADAVLDDLSDTEAVVKLLTAF